MLTNGGRPLYTFSVFVTAPCACAYVRTYVRTHIDMYVRPYMFTHRKQMVVGGVFAARARGHLPGLHVEVEVARGPRPRSLGRGGRIRAQGAQAH